ncbi:spinster family MFS transporter [Maricaulaceae bacterium MS644]
MPDTPRPGGPAKASLARAASGAWVALPVLMVVYLVNFMDRQLFAVLQEQIKVDLALSDSQLALLGGTMFAVFYATLGLPLAWLADRTNRVRLVALACAVWSIFTVLSGMATNFVTMALARIGVASGEAGGVSPSYSVLSDYFPPERRGFAIGLFSIGAPLGLMAGSYLGAAIAGALGWRWAFILLGAPGLLLALGLFLAVREPVRGRFDPGVEAPREPARPLDAIRAVLTTPSLMLLTLAAAATSFAGYGLYQWIPSFLQRAQGLELEAVGRFLSPIFALGVFGALAGGWIADRLGKTRPAAYALVPAATLTVSAPFFFAALITTDGRLSLLLLTLPTLLSYAWIGPTLAASQTLSSPAVRALVAAIMGFFNNLIGFGLGPLLVGVLSDTLQGAGAAPGEALRTALIVGAGGYVAAITLFVAAGFTIPRDLARRNPPGGAASRESPEPGPPAPREP